MKLPRSFLFLSMLALSWSWLPIAGAESWDRDNLPLTSVGAIATFDFVTRERVSVLLDEHQIPATMAGSEALEVLVAKSHVAEAARLLREAKEKEGLKVMPVIDLHDSKEWPEGLRVTLDLKAQAQLSPAGEPEIRGALWMHNPQKEALRLRAACVSSTLTFLVSDAAGNPIAPVMRGKADPHSAIFDCWPTQKYPLAKLSNLDFSTGSAWSSYDLKRGGNYRVIAVYRPLGKDGPGFCSDEVVLKIPEQ